MISEIKNRDTLLIDFEEDTSIPTSTYTFNQADVSRNEEVLLHLPKLDIKQPPIQSKKKEGRNKNKKSAHAGLPLLDSTREIKESTVFDILSSNQETHILESFKQSFKSNFRSLMKNIRAFRGELVVEAHFGRTMTHGIKDIYISKKGEYEKTYDEETTRRILNESKSNSLTPGFTKVITTVPAEIQFIREMKDCHGLNCWSQEKTDWSLYYELYFEDRNFSHNNNFIVEINAQSFVCRAKTISELGNLYVHGTTRLWDFRVAATDIKYTDRLDIEHSELVEMISTSLFIPYAQLKVQEICSLSSIKFEIKEPLNKRYHLEKALTRHIDKYLSRDNQSILQISEIQSLEILKRNFLNKKLIIKAFFTDCLESNSSQLLRLWFEVSVSSTSLNIELAKNQKLELGELADWSVDDLTFSSIANSIYLPACWILERIDGVGSYNDNGFDIQESFLSTTTDKPEILPYYW
ncbi:hypothetical protein HI914_05155 [Erysiphe necator]|nr:hypothetical protein HI914_05155 [Erysiphe necator]